MRKQPGLENPPVGCQKSNMFILPPVRWHRAQRVSDDETLTT